MKNYVVTYAKVGCTTVRSGVTTPPQPLGEKQFLVEAEDEGSARAYAKRFENIGLDWSYGITTVQDVRVAEPDDLERLKFSHLSGYESMFPDR